MVDKYINWANSKLGKPVVKKLGLPSPVKLKRYSPTKYDVNQKILIGSFKPSPFLDSLYRTALELPVTTFIVEDNQILRKNYNGSVVTKDDKLKFNGLIFDATQIENTTDLQSVYNFFHPLFRRIELCGRVIILARTPQSCTDVESCMVNRSLVGFVKSLAKEVRRGIAVQLVYVTPDAAENIESSIEFLLSAKSAYVSGQVIRITKSAIEEVQEKEKPLLNKLALVTGASRGIGKSIAEVLARDGAKVICLDIEPQHAALEKLAEEIHGNVLTLDITGENAPQTLVDYVKQQGGLDILVHNAGITRDKMFVNMKPEVWNQVIDVNLTAQQAINQALLAENLIKPNGRIICVSSIAGIAGNAGQTNYATSKAGVIGLVKYTAQQLKQNITINAVAPGFIETKMTAKIPFAIREVGRRANAMSQGGLPVDVAETIAWFANPASSGVNGNVVRVCGLSILGA